MTFDNKYDSARPYIACFVILRRNNKVAMIKRQNTGWMDGYYGLPAGKVEYGEPFALAAVREAKEEVGVDIKINDLKYVHTVHRHAEKEDIFMDWVDIYFEASDWSGEPHNAEQQKADDFCWIDLIELPNNIVPTQRDALTRIACGDYYSEYGWN